MILELPYLSGVIATFPKSRTEYTIRLVRKLYYDVEERASEGAGDEIGAVIGASEVWWKNVDGKLYRPILRPDGVVASIEEVCSFTSLLGPNVPFEKTWWEDHPFSFSNELLPRSDPYRSTLRETDKGWWRLSRATWTKAISPYRWIPEYIAADLLIIDGVMYKAVAAPGLVVGTDRRGKVRMDVWIPPLVAELSVALHFPWSLREAAYRCAELMGARATDRPQFAGWTKFDTTWESHLATLQSARTAIAAVVAEEASARTPELVKALESATKVVLDGQVTEAEWTLDLLADSLSGNKNRRAHKIRFQLECRRKIFEEIRAIDFEALELP